MAFQAEGEVPVGLGDFGKQEDRQVEAVWWKVNKSLFSPGFKCNPRILEEPSYKFSRSELQVKHD